MINAYVFTGYGGPETQEFRNLPTPAPGPSELRIAVRAAGVNALVAEGKLDPHVRETFPLSQAGSALQAVEAGHARGKIVLTID